MRVPCEHLGTAVQLDPYAKRIVSLSSGLTEALFEMGYADRVVGVSPYCSRYADCTGIPVAGSYLHIDYPVLKDLDADVILLTSGIQLALARSLSAKGYPVYVVPLPASVWDIAGNSIRVSSLCGDAEPGRALAELMITELITPERKISEDGPLVYAEAWFGVHPRTIGGASFIHDIIRWAGGRPLFGSSPFSYGELNLSATAEAKPDVFLGFHEPDHPVDFAGLSRERGWDELFSPGIITSDITKGRNIIHDGPSLVETVRWLQESFAPLS